MFPSIKSSLREINVYSSRTALYLSGLDTTTCTYRIMTIKRPSQTEENTVEGAIPNLQIHCDPQIYTQVALNKYIRELSEATTLQTLCENADLIFGFIQLLEACYLIVVTKKKKVASLHGHTIYTIDETQTIPITYKLKPTVEESKYRSILQYTDLTKNFYFSFTYDITNTMQNNFLQYLRPEQQHKSTWHSLDAADSPTDDSRIVRDMFVWNTYALRPLLSENWTNIQWIVPVVHGFVKQRKFRLSSGILMKYTLIARRSRMFAGTRYLRRGVNIDGYVANEVESESIFTRETTTHGLSPRSSAMVQMRGSIPLMWGNTSFTSMKPDIRIEDKADPHRTATRAHIRHLTHRYGNFITFLSLIRQKESKAKEQLVAADLVNAMDYISDRAPASLIQEPMPVDKSYSKLRFRTKIGDDEDPVPVNICSYDFLNASHDNLFPDIETIQESAFPHSGFFVQPPPSLDTTLQNAEYLEFPLYDDKKIYDEILQNRPAALGSSSTPSTSSEKYQACFGEGFPKGLLQTGVFRTNCIDCLDRTNVGMFIYAKISTYRQLRALGIDMSSNGLSSLLAMMTGIWAEHGDVIAYQYAGSGAMHKVEAQNSSNEDDGFEIKVVGGVGNALVAAKRYYSNVSTDFDRQQSMDLLLGIFVPRWDRVHIWNVVEELQIKRSTGRRESDALQIMKQEKYEDQEKNEVPIRGSYVKEMQWRETSLQAAILSSKTPSKAKLICIVDPTPKCKFYDDIDQPSLSLSKFEDQLIVSECDTLGADNLQSRPYTTFVKEPRLNLLKRYESYVPGYVEQDLYFGRKGFTLQENLYDKYCRLENIPLYAPSSTIFDGDFPSTQAKLSPRRAEKRGTFNHRSPEIYRTGGTDAQQNEGQWIMEEDLVEDKEQDPINDTMDNISSGVGRFQGLNTVSSSGRNNSSSTTTSRLAAWFSSKAKRNSTTAT